MRFQVNSLQHSSGLRRHAIGIPRRGPNRERARHAILAVVNRAATAQARAAFTTVYSDGQQWRLGGKGGYDPASVLEQIQLEAADPFRWLEDQLHDRRPARPAVLDQVIIDLTP